MLNFNFTIESLLIEKFDKKYCFLKAVQKLAKRESDELVQIHILVSKMVIKEVLDHILSAKIVIKCAA